MGEPSTRRAGTGPRALALTVALLSLSSRADAFFRNLMIGQLAAARIDPIVKPGGPSQHCHHLNGGSNLGFDATGETLAASNCTNSMITQDKSTYWTPWMYFQHDNGSFESVDLALGVTAYYKYEARPGTEGKTIQPFPKDFRMLSGDSNKRTWNGPWPVPPTSQWGKDDTTQDALAEKALGFNCMHYYNGEAAEGSFQYPWLRNKEFIDANCPQGIRAEVLFPSCWDGENNDSENHKDHTAFPAGLDAGKCPDTHPVYLPILFYETIWNTQTFAGVPGQFVMANGDPTGMGYHGDFLASWPEGLQEQIRDNPACTGPQSDGQMSSCPLFDITDQSTARSCKLEMPEVLQDEMTTGVIDALPGNVKVSGSQHDPGSPQGPIASFTSAVASFVTGFPGIGPTGVASPSSTSTPMGVPGLNPTTTGFATGSATMPTIDPATVPAVTQAAPNLVNTNVAANQGGSTSYTTYTSAGYVVEMAIIETVEVITTTIHPTNVVTAVVTSTAQAAAADQFKKWDSKHAQRHARDIKKHAHGVHNHHF